MGYWRITVDGCGCHHNNKPEIDANAAAADFVETLKSQGHTLSAARFEMTDANDGHGKVLESSQNIDFLAPTPQPAA